jgi:hypothetical protein
MAANGHLVAVTITLLSIVFGVSSSGFSNDTVTRCTPILGNCSHCNFVESDRPFCEDSWCKDMPSEVDDNGDCVKNPGAQFCNLTADKCSVLQDSCGIPISYGHSPEYCSRNPDCDCPDWSCKSDLDCYSSQQPACAPLEGQCTGSKDFPQGTCCVGAFCKYWQVSPGNVCQGCYQCNCDSGAFSTDDPKKCIDSSGHVCPNQNNC